MVVLNVVENQKGKNYYFIVVVDYYNYVFVNMVGVLILDIIYMYVLIYRQDRGGFVIGILFVIVLYKIWDLCINCLISCIYFKIFIWCCLIFCQFNKNIKKFWIM